MRRIIRVHFDDGNSLVTEINGTEQAIKDYYFGKYFNVGKGEEDLIVKCTWVDFLD